MNSKIFENQITREQFICPNTKDLRVIDGVEYLSVQKPGHPRLMLMRKDVLTPVKKHSFDIKGAI